MKSAAEAAREWLEERSPHKLVNSIDFASLTALIEERERVARDGAIEECAQICDEESYKRTDMINYEGQVALSTQGHRHQAAAGQAAVCAYRIRAMIKGGE